jgi:autophagy-related ATG101-like protein
VSTPFWRQSEIGFPCIPTHSLRYEQYSCDSSSDDRHRERTCLNGPRGLNICAQVLDRQNTREILCALLHAILFHRLFGTIRPQTFEVLDVTMVRLLTPLSPSHSHYEGNVW